MKKIILASGSPRRKQLLEWADLTFETIVADTDEHFDPEAEKTDIAISIAQQKARAVSQLISSNRESIIIAADTIVVADHKVIGKPKDKNDAISILSVLSGNTHSVITGVCMMNGERVVTFAETTIVAFHPLTTAQIEYYVDRYKPYDKAGAYAIQEWIGVVGVKSISGDFYNVMGLPVSRVLHHLQEF